MVYVDQDQLLNTKNQKIIIEFMATVVTILIKDNQV